jgi:hypothetical protein
MGTAIGLQTVFGTGVETDWGDPVEVDRWYPIVSEGLERQQEVVQSSGLRAGSLGRRSAPRALTHSWAEGPVELEVPVVGFGRWLHQMLGGTPATTELDAEDGVYSHVFELGSLLGVSQTIQKVLRDEEGDPVQAFTYPGAKVASWELSCAVGEMLVANLTMDALEELLAAPVTPHSYNPNERLYHFAQGAVLLGGSPVGKVTAASATGDNGLRTDAFYLGTGGRKGEQQRNDWVSVEGQLAAEFDDPSVFHALYVTDEPTSIVLEFTGPELVEDVNEQLIVEFPVVHFTGETPKVGGPDVVVPELPWEAAETDDAPLVRATYISTDPTP